MDYLLLQLFSFRKYNCSKIDIVFGENLTRYFQYVLFRKLMIFEENE